MDAIEFLKKVDNKIVDLILCDLPYGMTACKWDSIIPLDKLWEQYKRILKDDGNIVLTASQPFASILVKSNIEMFKYEWIWEKAVGSNFTSVKYQPMKEHENILVFGKSKSKYFPIMQERKGTGSERLKAGYKSDTLTGEVYGKIKGNRSKRDYSKLRYPSSVQFFNNREKDRGLHPTQKPLALFEYLIKTYTNERDLVVDNCVGSGTTAVACQRNNRIFMCCDNNSEYVKISNQRLIQKTVRGFNPLNEESLIHANRETSVEVSPNSKNLSMVKDKSRVLDKNTLTMTNLNPKEDFLNSRGNPTDSSPSFPLRESRLA